MVFPEETKAAKRPKRKRWKAQDGVVSMQTILTLVVLALALLTFWLFPDGFRKLQEGYTEFVTKPPLLDLSGVREFVTESWNRIFFRA